MAWLCFALLALCGFWKLRKKIVGFYAFMGSLAVGMGDLEKIVVKRGLEGVTSDGCCFSFPKKLGYPVTLNWWLHFLHVYASTLKMWFLNDFSGSATSLWQFGHCTMRSLRYFQSYVMG